MSQPDGSLNKKIKVLVVDDSAIIRKLYTRMLESDPGIVVVGTAPDPYVARDLLVSKKPDVMTLDIEMPRMDGISFLVKVMAHSPVRTLVISSLSKKGSSMALRAFEAGAIDVMEKPGIDVEGSLNDLAQEFVSRVKMVAGARLSAQTNMSGFRAPVTTTKPLGSALDRTTHQIMAIASSTGGTEALKVVLTKLPPDIPGTLIVQHMPPVFTKSYADNLNQICPFNVKEATDGDKVLPGQVLIAPGNYHMELSRSGAFYYVKLHQEPLLHGVRPAADYLMKSVAKVAGNNAIGAVLTGMGRDGAAGLLAMKEAGSYNIAQDEKSCGVYGMPKEAVEIGAIHKVLPLDQIAGEIVRSLRAKMNAAS